MNWFIILSLFFIWNIQECHCCMKWKRSADDCEGSDIADLLDEKADRSNIPITEKVGCVRNITCNADINTYVAIFLNASEIVLPDHVPLNLANKKWYVTKYPQGLSYYPKDSTELKFITGDLDGKRSQIMKIFW
ncbi:hypothetical protein CRE_21383 [Caenorhabditis remanei]|uniref:Uncharacterized protein n=1 Tax=Caenorhabditis remanei TaxID=31234 RepID=E3MUN3_CAERE|nr:hypothetical protein CRE_21383 [Caenorhabditis remanei]